MSAKKITALTLGTSVAVDDLIPFVDISDTSMSDEGTDKKGTISDVSAVAIAAASVDATTKANAAQAAAIAASQPLDSDLTAIAGLTPTDNDLVQRKSGAWTNRTPAQVKADLALVKADVGLGNVANLDTSTTANITDSTDKRFLTDAELALIASLGIPVVRETPSGVVDGSNVTFILAHAPIAGSEQLFVNGTSQEPGGVDYSISGVTITMALAPESGDFVRVNYRY